MEARGAPTAGGSGRSGVGRVGGWGGGAFDHRVAAVEGRGGGAGGRMEGGAGGRVGVAAGAGPAGLTLAPEDGGPGGCAPWARATSTKLCLGTSSTGTRRPRRFRAERGEASDSPSPGAPSGAS